MLDAEERHDLVVSMLEATLAATADSPGIWRTWVISPDPEVATIAEGAGAAALRQDGRGLNQGLEQARAAAVAAGASAVLVLPADLPRVSAAAIADILAVLDRSRPPVVAIVPDRHGRGTNALLLAPADVIDFAFGGDSRAAHRHAANDVCTEVVELGGPLALDLDTPDDLLLVQTDATVAADAG
jgi:2-phospho-L-lactate guanylyltransferase